MRRYLLLFAFLTLPFFGAGQEVRWLKFEEALALNEKEPRPNFGPGTAPDPRAKKKTIV